MKKAKNLISNANIQLYAFLIILFCLNEFAGKFQILDDFPIWEFLTFQRGVDTTPFRTFYYWNPVFFIPLLILIFVTFFFSGENPFSQKNLTKVNKYLLLPFTVLFTACILCTYSSLLVNYTELVKYLALK